MNRIDLERTIIGQCFLDPYPVEALTPGHFGKYAELFKHLQDIFLKKGEISPLFLDEKYQVFVLDITAEIVSAANVRAHVRELQDLASQNKFKLGAAKALECLPGSSKEILEKFEPLITDLSLSYGDGALVHLSKIGESVAKQLESEIHGLAGIKTGFPSIDKDDTIIRKGDFVILGARPSVGKSALAWQIAVQSGVNVAFFSQEMKAESLFIRQISQTTAIPRRDFKKHIPTIADGMEKIRRLKIWIDDSQGITSQSVLRKCRHFASVRDLGLVIVDYLQLMRFPGADSRREGVGAAAADLKGLAKELNVPVLCISSIRRALNAKEAPNMEDLKESGDIEFHADVILLMHRNLFDSKGETEIIKAKDRNGEVFKTKLRFDRYTTSFSEMEFNQKDWEV